MSVLAWPIEVLLIKLLVAPALIGLVVCFTQAVPAGTIRAEKKVRVAINGASRAASAAAVDLDTSIRRQLLLVEQLLGAAAELITITAWLQQQAGDLGQDSVSLRQIARPWLPH